MAKLCPPSSPDHVISAELQDTAAGGDEGSPTSSWEPDGLGYSKPRALTENSSGLPPLSGEPYGGEDALFAKGEGPSSSLRTEPDMDTIMPLRAGEGQMANVVSPTHSEEDEEGGGAEGRGYHRLSSEFTTVEHSLLESDFFEGDRTAEALEVCKRTVLNPYLIFLKLVGWRKVRIARYNLEPALWQKALNFIWPSLICLLLLTSCATQIVTCFRRDQVHITPKNGSDGEMFYHISCERHILTSFLIPDLLLFSAFLYGLYIFRWAQTEQLTTLTEAVFLGVMTCTGRYSHAKLTRTLQLMMVIGIAWIMFSFSTSIFRIPSLHLLDTNTQIQWIPSYKEHTDSSNLIERWVFVMVTLLGFVVLDMAYAAVVINYSVQCQLLIFLFCSICERIRSKDWGIERTIKELKSAKEFLSMLNSHLARAVSLLLFIFLTSSVQAISGLQGVKNDQHNFTLEVITGLLSIIQWTFMLVLPLVQAARVTRAARRMRKVGLEVRSRPYSYIDTPQLDLDSLVLYTTGLRMSAKLVNLAISPAVVGVLFFTVGFVLFLVFQYDAYHWAIWL